MMSVNYYCNFFEVRWTNVRCFVDLKLKSKEFISEFFE